MEKRRDAYSPVADDGLTCLECGKPMNYYGRSDRKFCSPECKNHYHNKKAGTHRNMRARALRALDRNWLILDTLLKNGKTCIRLSEALDAGFNIGFITSVTRSGGTMEYFCYDIRFRLSVGRIFGIRRIR